VEGGAKLLVFLMALQELAGTGVELGDDGHSARDGGAEDRKDGAFSSQEGLEAIGGEVLD